MTTSFDFMGLPPELRIKIYKEVLQSVDICMKKRYGSQGRSLRFVTSEQSPLELTMNLRLTNLFVQHELDYEIVRLTIAKVKQLIKTVHHPLGYSSTTQPNIPHHAFWVTQPLLTISPKAKTYKDIQNLQLTTYLSELHDVGHFLGKEVAFLVALAPHVRCLTLNIKLPEHLADIKECKVHRIMNRGVGTLIFHFFEAVRAKSELDRAERGPAEGVVKVQINFPAGYSRAGGDLWGYLAGGKEEVFAGLRVRASLDEEGVIRGVILSTRG